jgi:nitrite reductase/ring-hydroxylating ferredoxin subunit
MEKEGNLKKIAKLSDIKDKLCASVDGKKLALFKVKDKIYCIQNECSHIGGPLCSGKLEKTTIECPWHGSQFDVKTGKVKKGPAMKEVKTYKVIVKEGNIYVKI